MDMNRFLERENRSEHKTENKILESSSTSIIKHESRMDQMKECVENNRFKQKHRI